MNSNDGYRVTVAEKDSINCSYAAWDTKWPDECCESTRLD